MFAWINWNMIIPHSIPQIFVFQNWKEIELHQYFDIFSVSGRECCFICGSAVSKEWTATATQPSWSWMSMKIANQCSSVSWQGDLLPIYFVLHWGGELQWLMHLILGKCYCFCSNIFLLTNRNSPCTYDLSITLQKKEARTGMFDE